MITRTYTSTLTVALKFLFINYSAVYFNNLVHYKLSRISYSLIILQSLYSYYITVAYCNSVYLMRTCMHF
jgi:hypothetical protein